MIVSVDTEKSFDKIQHPLLITLNILGIRRKLHQPGSIYEKPTTNIIIILNGRRLSILPIRSVISQRCPFSPFIFSMVLEALAIAIRQENTIKSTQIVKEKVQFYLLADNMFIQRKFVGIFKKFLQLIYEFSKVLGYIVNI